MVKVAQGKYEYWLTEEGLLLLEGWAREGLTDEQIANKIGISRSTLNDWKKKHPDISDTLKKGKEVVDTQVENALLQSALDGNITAIIFWLKNRKPSQWKDKPQPKADNNEDLKASIIALADLINKPQPNRNIKDFEENE